MPNLLSRLSQIQFVIPEKVVIKPPQTNINQFVDAYQTKFIGNCWFYKKAQEEKRLFIENRFRVSQGLKPFLNFQDFLDSDPEEFNELSEKIVLEEAARILIDQINLNKPNRLSSSDFR